MGEAAIIFGNINEFQQNNERTKPFVFHNFQNEIIATTQTKLKKTHRKPTSILTFLYSQIHLFPHCQHCNKRVGEIESPY